LLVAITVLVVPAGGGGWLYLIFAVLLGGYFIALAARMWSEDSARLAWRLFKYSNYYLALLLAVLVLDRVLGL
jgi:protoheme IX farnesyltransferase